MSDPQSARPPAVQVLCIDDDRINLLLFEHACAGFDGVQVCTATSGAEALALARAQPPQLLVIDLHLPDTDGHALLAELRRDAALSNVPAYLYSADDGEDVRRAAAAAGFAGCWSKPVDIGLLRRELAALGFVRSADDVA